MRSASSLGAPSRGGRVLVVDDKASNREVLRQELEEAGFEVATAGSGTECLHRAATWGPHVVLLDIHMPGMDGIETCRRLKAEPATAHVPVVFVTADDASDARADEALRAGGNDFLAKPYTPTILLARVSCQIAMFRAHATLRQLAVTDELTGMVSRRYFVEAVEQAVRDALRHPSPSPLGLLLVDIDRFRAINQTLGHAAGDDVLKRVAQAIKGALRTSDIVCRFGGEEFAVLLPQAGSASAGGVADKVRRAVARQVREPIPVTVSVGAFATEAITTAAVERHGGPEGLVRHAVRQLEDALGRAKATGRDRVVVA